MKSIQKKNNGTRTDRVRAFTSVIIATAALVKGCGADDEKFDIPIPPQRGEAVPVAGSGGTLTDGGQSSSGFGGRSDAGIAGSSGYAGETSAGGSSGIAGSSGYAGIGGNAGSGGTGGVGGTSGTGGVGGTAGTGAVSGTGGVGGTSGTGGVGGTGGLPPLGGHAGAAGEAGYAGTAGSGAYAGYAGTAGSGAYAGYAGTAGSGAYAGYAGTAGSGAYAGSGGTVNDGGVTDGSVGGTGGTVIDAGVCEVSNGYEASALIGIQGTGIEVGGYRFRYVGEDTQTNEIIVKITCGDEVIVTDMRIPFGNQVTIVDGTNQKQITVGELAHSSTAARISIRVSDADLDGGISDGGVEDGGSDAGLEPRCVGVHRDSTEYSMLIRLGTTIDVGGYLVTPKQLTPDNIVLTDVLCASDNVVVTSDTECTISPHPNIISVPEDGKEINVIIHAASEYAARVTIQVKNL